jgi:hypothetical protein
MKKYDGIHRKRLSRKKREALKWEQWRADSRFGGSVSKMKKYLKLIKSKPDLTNFYERKAKALLEKPNNDTEEDL